MLLMMSMDVAWAMDVSVPRSAPLGHRTYTYQAKPFAAFTSFNTEAAAMGTQPVSIVNTYGGWFTSELINAKVSCDLAPPGADPPQALPVANTATQPVVVLTCATDGCKGAAWTHCKRTIPARTNATLVLDPGLHYIYLIYNDSYAEECWPKQYGYWPALLTLPLGADAKAQCTAPTPATPVAIPAGDVKHLNVQPGGATGAPFSDVSEWSRAPGVTALTVNFDGRMDLCAEYAEYNVSKAGCSDVPDVSVLDDAGLAVAADTIAKVVCAIPSAGTAQIDLEPFSGVYKPHIVKLMGLIAAALRSPTPYGCVDAAHPNGRAVSLFTFAESIANAGLIEAMGPNGMVVLSGYDLYPDTNDTKFNSPAEYATKLKRQVEAWLALPEAADTQWTLGLPMSASAHEYEAYVPDASREHCGPACTPYNNTVTQDAYISAALDVIEAMGTGPDGVFAMNATSRFRGLSLWLWSGPNTTAGQYPPNSGNYWLPTNPSSATLSVLHKRLF